MERLKWFQNQKIYKPELWSSQAEEIRCLTERPRACNVIQELMERASQSLPSESNGRRSFDWIRQEVDRINGHCQAFTTLNSHHRRSNKVEELPCQMLRKYLMVECLGGKWKNRKGE